MKWKVRSQTLPGRGKQLLNAAMIMILTVVTIPSPIQASPKRGESCPSELKTLMTWMLEDLPGYSNRVTQRARQSDRTIDIYNYIVLAGNPEFTPLPLTHLQYEPVLSDETKQVFFTTLERQYTKTEVILLQNYYWLFLTPSSDGWRLVLLFSQLADLEEDDLPLPPQDAMNGAIGQGIQLWLKDCRAGVLRR
ncbi:MAG: hypothetical protein QNJ33_06660 [Crocosphaera sp.]|nr:hypothetical protein [Crocosphaera sp.]